MHIVRQARGSVLGVAQSAALWRQLDDLPAQPSSKLSLPQANADDETHAARMLWGSVATGLQVELLRIDGGGHVEPSKQQRIHAIYRMLVGPQNHDVETAEEAWTFF